ncbi:hypothetical protein [uncultured Paraglaciecola sp.]|uniref:hypothetical protein n=1 Tax=uncultured Paraglaciecola sp. TaxID=1765024 RepID=UPI00260F5D17|nr:hypothetical protein [uncultured Paraglaciecola sp.]
MVAQAIGEPQPLKAQTDRWATVQQRLDGKWVFPKVPDAMIASIEQSKLIAFLTQYGDGVDNIIAYTLEEYDASWFEEEVAT